MKKLLAILASLALLSVVSCNEKDNADGSGSDEITEINVATSCALVVGSGETVIPVYLTPSNLGVKEYVSVSGGDESVITWRLVEDGIAVTPVGSGKSSLKVSAVKGPASSVSIEFHVINGIKSMYLAYNKTKGADPMLLGSQGRLSEGKKYYLDLQVTDNEGKTIYTPAQWEVEGDCFQIHTEDISAVLEVTSSKGNPSAKIIARPLADPSKSTYISATAFAAPQSISVSSEDLYFKKGGKAVVGVSVLPANALQVLEHTSEIMLFQELSVVGDFKKYYEISCSGTAKDVDVKFSSVVSPSVSKTIKASVSDYDADDVKPGDYVFAGSDGKLRSADCGLRFADGSYEGGQAVNPNDVKQSGESLVGIIIRCEKNTVANIFGSNLLQFNGTPGLETDTQYFPGLKNHSGYHGLIVGKKIAEGATWDTSQIYRCSGLKTDAIGVYQTHQLCYSSTPPSSTFVIAYEFYQSMGSSRLQWFLPGASNSLYPLNQRLYIRKSFIAADMDLKRSASASSSEPTYIWSITDSNKTNAYYYRMVWDSDYYYFSNSINEMSKSGSASIVPLLFF